MINFDHLIMTVLMKKIGTNQHDLYLLIQKIEFGIRFFGSGEQLIKESTL